MIRLQSFAVESGHYLQCLRHIANTQRRKNIDVVLNKTLNRRCFNVFSTLDQRCFNVMCVKMLNQRSCSVVCVKTSNQHWIDVVLTSYDRWVKCRIVRWMITLEKFSRHYTFHRLSMRPFSNWRHRLRKKFATIVSTFFPLLVARRRIYLNISCCWFFIYFVLVFCFVFLGVFPSLH